jgi:hypothetical protein
LQNGNLLAVAADFLPFFLPPFFFPGTTICFQFIILFSATF